MEEPLRDDRQSPPDEAAPLPGSVTVLELGDKTIYLVGTAHISERSVADVEAVIDAVRPESVCVELCEARYQALVDQNRWQKLDIFKVIKEGKTLYLLANLAIGAYQRRLGAELGVKPGAEMLAAVRKAEEHGASICLADRDVRVTLKRTWANVGFFRRAQLLVTMFDGLFARKEEKLGAEDIEKLKEKANLSEIMKEFARILPEVKGPLIDERDRYLISSIREAPGKRIVAVVGAAHVEGMARSLNEEIDRDELSAMPPPSRLTRILKWAIPTLVLAAFSWPWVRPYLSGYYEMADVLAGTWRGTEDSAKAFAEVVTAWVLPNSIVCALLTAVALARPLSIVAAFIASPITSLNPLLPAGAVVGLTEAYLRRPSVADAERINEDVQTVRGVYRNRFTRVLLVAVLSTIGSAMGAWIGIGWIGALLGAD